MITAIETLSLQALASPPAGRSPAALVSADLLALLDHFDCGVMIIDADKEIAAMNDAARSLLGDGLTVTRHRLRASTPTLQNSLETLLETARREGVVRNMALSRPSDEQPLILRAQPLFRDRAIKGEGSALVLLFVMPAAAEPTQAPGEALRALGLTRAEAEVAIWLGAGLSPREVSDRLEIKIATVRAHLKRIFQKLGLCRQAELVQLVTRLGFIK